MRTASWIASLVLLLLPLAGGEEGPSAQHLGATILAVKSGAASTADWELTLRIRQMLAQDADLAPLNPHVQSSKGIVTLSGPVPSAYFRRHAEERVLTVPGVRQVRNELTVRNAPAQERPNVAADQPALPMPPLADTSKLIGPPQVRNKAAPLARLASRIEVEPVQQREREGERERERVCVTDADLRFAVERFLRNNPRFAGVTATVQDGQVRLGGTVRTAAERDDLVKALRALDGVGAVQGERVEVHGRGP